MNEFNSDIDMSSALVKTRLLELTAEDIQVISSIYRNKQRNASLRLLGVINFFLGLLTLTMGLPNFSNSWLNQIQVILAILTILQSLWGLVLPTTSAVAGYAILFLLCGAWNILLFVLILSTIQRPELLIGVLGGLQIWWAWKSFQTYRIYRGTPDIQPEKGFTHFYDEAWNQLRSGLFRKDPASVRLTTGRAIWEGLLLGDKAVFACRRAPLLAVQYRENLNFLTNETKPSSKPVHGKIKLNLALQKATMERTSFEKYMQWKSEKEATV